MATDRQETKRMSEPMHAMMVCGEAAWQLPFILYASWWNALASGKLWSMQHPWYSHAEAQGEDHQLDVPDVIEEEGEHALFA